MIDDAGAAIVRQIVTMRAAGYSLQSIATTLNDAGSVPKRGKWFYPSTVRYMLDNPKYSGLTEYYFRHDGEAHCLSKRITTRLSFPKQHRWGLNRTARIILSVTTTGPFVASHRSAGPYHLLAKVCQQLS